MRVVPRPAHAYAAVKVSFAPCEGRWPGVRFTGQCTGELRWQPAARWVGKQVRVSGSVPARVGDEARPEKNREGPCNLASDWYNYRFVAAGVAQLVEHLICNQRVGGSNPFASSS